MIGVFGLSLRQTVVDVLTLAFTGIGVSSILLVQAACNWLREH